MNSQIKSDQVIEKNVVLSVLLTKSKKCIYIKKHKIKNTTKNTKPCAFAGKSQKNIGHVQQTKL